MGISKVSRFCLMKHKTYLTGVVLMYSCEEIYHNLQHVGMEYLFMTLGKYFTTGTARKMKFSTKDFFRKCDQIHRKLRDFVTVTEKILSGKLHFLYIVGTASEEITNRPAY